MRLLEKIGNLKVYRIDDSFSDRFYGGETIRLKIYNGSDCVGSDTFFGFDEGMAVENLMARLFDTYTLSAIRAGCTITNTSHGGALISGKTPGFNKLEYFKRVGNTRFYKHFNHKPMM